MFLYTLEMDKGRQAKRASFFSMLSNGWALLFGLVLLNNKSRENVPLRSEPLTTPGPNHLLENFCDFLVQFEISDCVSLYLTIAYVSAYATTIRLLVAIKANKKSP